MDLVNAISFIKISLCIPEIGEKMPPKVLSDRLRFRCNLDLWHLDLQTYSVRLCPQMHGSCKFGEILASGL